VFVEKLDADDEPMKGFSTMGAVNAYSTTSAHFQITAVGEVPPLTVRQIATSVVPVADAK
jgi:negative regulator of sigma E activity